MNITVYNNQHNQNFTAFKLGVTGNITAGKSTVQKHIERHGNSKLDKFKEALKNYILGYPKRINYTWQHKKAFLKVEKELCGKNSLSGYMHDADKLFMYIIGVPKKTAHNIHVAMAPHHLRNGKIKKPMMAIIDWECARYTKPDKPLNAREFYEAHYIKKLGIRIPEIEVLLDKYGL